MDYQKKVSLFKQYLKTHLESSGNHFAWVDHLDLIEVSSRRFVICRFPNEVFRDYLTVHHDSKVREALEAVFPEKAPFKSKKIEYWLGHYQPPQKQPTSHQKSFDFFDDASKVEQQPKPVQTLSPVLSDQIKEFTLSPTPAAYPKFQIEHTFENFAVGESNNLAFEAARQIVHHPNNYNPLVIYGAHGVGKTHLIEAIGLGVTQSQPELRIEYISAENFLNAFSRSLQNKNMEEFRQKYRQCDVFILDGLQILEKANACQEELLHTINELLQRGKQVVVACIQKPSEFEKFRYELLSKLESGLLAQISRPTINVRISCVKQIAKRLDFTLPAHICELVAKCSVEDMRKIREALIRLKAHASLLKREINTKMVRHELQVFEETLPIAQTGNGHIQTILEKICENDALLEEDICSKKRGDRLTEARDIYAYLAREMTDLTLTEISRPLGRSHSAMSQSIKKLEETLQTNDILRRKVEKLRLSIQSQVNELRKQKRS